MISRFVGSGVRRSIAALATLTLAAVVGLPDAARAQPGTIKVGTLASEGSPWHKVLKDIGERWRKASKETIKTTIYAGTVGDEPDMVRKMRLNQLQAAAVTSVGLETIAKELSALSIPLLFESFDEVDYVRQKMGPRLAKALEDKGFIVLNWGDAGWMRYFTVRPAPTLADLQKLKLWIWAGSPQSEAMYKDAGFKPVPLAPTDILPSLQTGIIEAFPYPAILALASQGFGLARYMVDLKFAPIVGATIITKQAWEKIDPALRPALLKEAQDAGERLKAEIRAVDDKAVEEMKKRGLTVVTMTPTARQQWQNAAETFYSRVRGEIVQPREFDEVMALVKEYRASQAKSR